MSADHHAISRGTPFNQVAHGPTQGDFTALAATAWIAIFNVISARREFSASLEGSLLALGRAMGNHAVTHDHRGNST